MREAGRLSQVVKWPRLMEQRNVDGVGLNTVPWRNAVRFGFFVRSYGDVHTFNVSARISGGRITWWGKWDVPQAVGFVVVAFDDDITVFYNVDVVFCEYCGAIFVADLANGDEGSIFKVVKDMAGFCRVGEFRC